MYTQGSGSGGEDGKEVDKQGQKKKVGSPKRCCILATMI